MSIVEKSLKVSNSMAISRGSDGEFSRTRFTAAYMALGGNFAYVLLSVLFALKCDITTL